jgi:hypothetical protein
MSLWAGFWYLGQCNYVGSRISGERHQRRIISGKRSIDARERDHFTDEESPEGGYEARALVSIFTEADGMES